MDEAKHDFKSSHGKFYAMPGRVERVEGSSLQAMFLPKLQPEGRRLINACYRDQFVRGQLKHYGVEVDENKMSGNGALLLKEVLQAGKCAKVPDHIIAVREQLHARWLSRQTPQQLSRSPEFVMDKYFLSFGHPDRTKTTAVVGIPLDRNSSYCWADQMREAASKVADLYHETGFGPETQTIFMGWDPVAVRKAAESHAAKEAKPLRAKKDEREYKRKALHSEYMDTLKLRKASENPETFSPVGSYMVDCKEVEKGFLVQPTDLSIDICETKEPGMFKACFDFGVLVGVMIISVDKNALEQYISRLDRESESDGNDNREYDDDDDDDDEDEYAIDSDRKSTIPAKRKAETLRGRGRPPKKPKTGVAQPRVYQIRLKCRETEGMIHATAERGSIRFKDDIFSGFIGRANLPGVDDGVRFSARKISDTPARRRAGEGSWADYSERAYGYAYVNRWH
ncbi:uncharacterized protein LY89DRAFT_683786 [Mollisia scopiformis]|uniref:Uncharacterized protein n=1 Tax=Mollisia scopiformis TaxID=149040 RepID=A0A194XGR5_MOLSC|nr:uncharacterized protein LY89DRAFT_683786 [Mollisia scopiformis]KUJ18962.1 hypothetical protein LY89DRAFT_683786 [Mollisia scopiformis]